jgi:hypothetical protein
MPSYQLLSTKTLGDWALCPDGVANYPDQGPPHTVTKGRMASIQEFRCEVCGIVTSNPIHWFIIRCGESELTVHRWNTETANAAGARHYCGEAHAQVYISRWFESVCTPPKPTFK